MTVTLTPEKILRVKERCMWLLRSSTNSIHNVAEAIGLIVSCFPGVLHGPLFYRHLEHDKTKALQLSKGDYLSPISLSKESLAELQWWCDNVHSVNYPICLPNSKVDVTFYSDASNSGWGAVMGQERAGGRWTTEEATKHINCLELLPALFGLQAFCRNMNSVHIRIYSDNTTTVNYVNSMGGTRSMECNGIAKAIWLFCMKRKIWVSAAHIPGVKNVLADKESRVFQDNKEWMLRPDIFKEIENIWGRPSCDLFASRLNKQVPIYASWRPDPGAAYIDAFSINWNNHFFYAFPPFSLIARCLHKIEMDEAEGIIVTPLWPTQPWYAKLLHLIVDVPRILPQQRTTLIMTARKGVTHPLAAKMSLMACKLSGSPLKHKEFLRKLGTLSCNHGDQGHANSIPLTSTGGRHTVVQNRSVTFLPLYQRR